jgi:hypothetical protein
LLLLIIFTLAFGFAHFKNGINDCGCLGTFQQLSIPPVLSFIRNMLLIVLSIVVWMKYPVYNSEITNWKKYVILAAMVISIFIAGFTFRLPASFQKIAEKPSLENHLVKNTELSNLIKTSYDSSYLVFCFSYSCPHCWNSIENLRQFINMKIADRVYIFGMGEKESKEYFIQNFKPDFLIQDITHEKMVKLTTIYPTAFYIRHDSIKAVIQGVLPSAITFKKYYLESNFQ